MMVIHFNPEEMDGHNMSRLFDPDDIGIPIAADINNIRPTGNINHGTTVQIT